MRDLWEGFFNGLLGGKLDGMVAAAADWYKEKPSDPGRSVALAAIRIAAAQHRLNLKDGASGEPELFQSAIAEVKDFLESQSETAATNPHYLTLMIRIAIAENADAAAIEALAEQAAKAFPAYPTPFLVVAEHFATRKDAKAEDIEAFARKSVEWLGGSAGEALYARIYLHLAEAVHGTDFYKATRIDWPYMKRAIAALTKLHPTGGWNRSGFAMMSCVAGDQETTAELITPIYDDGHVPPAQHWGTVEFFKASWAWSKGTRGLRFEQTFGPLPKLELYGSKLRFKPASTLTSVAKVEMENRLYEDVNRLVLYDDLTALEELISEYRETDARTVDGYSKMDNAYWASHATILPVDADEQTTRMLEIARKYAEKNSNSAIAVNIYAHWLLEATKKTRARTISPENELFVQDTFRRQMKKVLEFLEAHAEAGRKDAHWHSLRINALYYLNVREPDFRAAVEEALTTHPSYMRIYAASYHYFKPGNGGSHEAIDSYVKWATGFAKEEDRDLIYAQLYDLAAFNNYGMGVYHYLNVDWSRMRKGLGGLVARYPSMWNVHTQAYHACLVGDREVARTALERIKKDDKHPSPRVFQKIWGSKDLMDACASALADSGNAIPRAAKKINAVETDVVEAEETIENRNLNDQKALPRVIKLGKKQRRKPARRRN